MKNTNETILAVILASKLAHPAQSPARTANEAHQLCAYGRTFKRLSENLCGAPDPDGRVERRRVDVVRKAKGLAKEYGITNIRSDDGIILRFEYADGCVLALL